MKNLSFLFRVKDDTNESIFSQSLSKIYDGSATDEDSSYVLEHVEEVKSTQQTLQQPIA